MWWLLWVPIAVTAYFGLAVILGKFIAVGMGTHPAAPHPAAPDLRPPERPAPAPGQTPPLAIHLRLAATIGAILTAIFTVP